MKALVAVNCFPPLVKNAGGVSKRYLTLCRALIDGLGWQVSLLTPVAVGQSGEADVERWLANGSLVHLAARGVRIRSATDGVAVFLDLFSFVNTGILLKELVMKGGYNCVFMDDVPWRLQLILLTRALGIPAVVSSHTDCTHMKAYKGVVKLVWNVHMLSTHFAALHATVSRVFGEQMRKTYGVPVGGVWPAILWAKEFKSEPSEWEEQARKQRELWLEQLRRQGCTTPKAIMLSAGRWSAEKRIHLLVDVVPKDCALVIVGDGTSEYCKDLLNMAGPAAGRPNVLALRKMLNASDLRLAYSAADLFLSASNFETLGNTIIEAWCSGTPVAVQPAQGHLEFVKDGDNSWFVDYDSPDDARMALARIAASGLTTDALAKDLPGFQAMGSKFRGLDFARELDIAIIQPALTVARQQMRATRPVELCKRLACLWAWAILWFWLRMVNRAAYVFSKEPSMEVLGKLGSAVEERRLSQAKFDKQQLELQQQMLQQQMKESPADTQEDVLQPLLGEIGTDYESHYASARTARRKSSSFSFIAP